MLSSQQQQSPYKYDDDDEILRGKYIIIRLVVQDRKVRATVTQNRVANAGKTIDGSFLSGKLCSRFIPVHSLSVILAYHSGDTKNKIKDFFRSRERKQMILIIKFTYYFSNKKKLLLVSSI